MPAVVVDLHNALFLLCGLRYCRHLYGSRTKKKTQEKMTTSTIPRNNNIYGSTYAAAVLAVAVREYVVVRYTCNSDRPDGVNSTPHPSQRRQRRMERQRSYGGGV